MLRKAIESKKERKETSRKRRPRLKNLDWMFDNENAINKYFILKHKAQDRKKVSPMKQRTYRQIEHQVMMKCTVHLQYGTLST